MIADVELSSLLADKARVDFMESEHSPAYDGETFRVYIDGLMAGELGAFCRCRAVARARGLLYRCTLAMHDAAGLHLAGKPGEQVAWLDSATSSAPTALDVVVLGDGSIVGNPSHYGH